MRLIYPILEYSARELVNLAKSDTPNRYLRRQSLGTPKVKSAYVNYNNGSAIITLDTHDHVQQVILEDFVQLVADEVLNHIDSSTTRNDIVKLVKLAVKVIIQDGDVLVDCDCDDYKYRFNWIAKQYGYAAKDRVQGHNYAPKITNPKLKGAMCKHLIRVLSRITYWNDTASRLLINDLVNNREFVKLINDELLDKINYQEDKDYDINQEVEYHPLDDTSKPYTDHVDDNDEYYYDSDDSEEYDEDLSSDIDNNDDDEEVESDESRDRESI